MRSMVEGAPLLASVNNSKDYPFKVVENLCRRDAHSKETQFAKMSVPSRIARRAIAPVVRFAVDLYRQPRRQAGEVERKPSLRALLPETKAPRPLPQRPPEEPSGRAQLLPEPACELYRLDRRLQNTRAPSTSLRLVPLPGPGRSGDHPRLRWMRAVRSVVQTSSSRWLIILCSKVTIPASGRDLESLSEITSVSALRVSPMNTGLGIRTLS
jgi:hypothetical protein